MMSGQVAFDDVRLSRVVPVYHRVNDISLGSGEVIEQGRYTFDAPLGQASANHARPLAWQACQFNTQRWVLSSPSTVVVYRHRIGRAQRSVKVNAQIGWHQHGELLVEVKGQDTLFQELGTIAKVGSASFEVPAELLPADELWVRFSARKKAGESESPALQLHAYHYEAALAGDSPDQVGATQFLAVREEDPHLKVTVLGIGDALPGGRNVAEIQLHNPTDHLLALEWNSTVSSAPYLDTKSVAATTASPPLKLAAGATSQVLRLPYELGPGESHRLTLSVTGDASFTAETTITVPSLHAAHYGQTLPGSTKALQLWWCSSGWKISAQRPAPKGASEAIVIRAAANETEAAQLVIRPQAAIRGLVAKVSDLTSADGHQIPAAAIDIQRVRYVHVTQPTDASSTVGLWPDPLPPLRAEEDVMAHRNFPLWIRVHVPKGQAAGLYRGSISVSGHGVDVTTPLHIHVFGFELPDRMSCKTAFGLDTSLIWKYHRTTSERQRREVLAKYFKCLSDHHISPYQPAPLDPIRVSWANAPLWSGGERNTLNPHNGEVSLKVSDNSTTANASTNSWPRLTSPRRG